MKLLNEYKVQFFVYLIASSLFLILICTSILTFVEFERSRFVKEDFDRGEVNFVQFEKKMIQSKLSDYVNDLLFFRDMVESSYFNTNIKNRDESKDKLSEYFYFFARRVQRYESISFLDLKGNEIVKVSYDGKKAYVSHPSELENYGKKEFFSAILNMRKNQIYMSELEIDEYDTSTSSDDKSYVRICIPIVNNSIRKGIMMFVFDVDELLSFVNHESNSKSRQIYIVNSYSEFISSSQKVMGLGEKSVLDDNERMDEMYPREWEILSKMESGKLSSRNGYFTFVGISAEDIYLENSTSEYELIFGDRIWYVISHVNRASYLSKVLNENMALAILSIVQKNIWLYAFLVIASVFLSILFVYNKYTKERIQYYSEYDDMTKALNRRVGREKLENTIENSGMVSICFLDVNGLKLINDTLGHEYGDELLVAFSDIVISSTRKNDLFVRQGGDEFLIILPGLNENGAAKVWQRIQASIEEFNQDESRAYEMSVSCGIVDLKSVDLGENMSNLNVSFVAEQLVKLADEKMYEDKSNNKNNIILIR